MKLSICKLIPKGALHLGERETFREDTEVFIHSDTLFSALSHCYLLLHGGKKLEELLKRFAENSPPFLISSAFPFNKDDLYFPIPQNQSPEKKEYRKMHFAKKEAFESLLHGGRMENLSEEDFTQKDKASFFRKEEVPRVSLSRTSNHPGEEFFHMGEVRYDKGAGLFFLFKIEDKSIEKEFYTTIRLMCDEGVGGDRTVGKGLFYQPEFQELQLSTPDTSSAITLSLYLPKEEELFDLKEGFYQIIERRGYVYSPLCQTWRRKSVRVFSEGSVFPSKKIGRLVDVTPQDFTSHKIYRYGFAFCIPCRLNHEG